ncbi:hypothetical protein G7Y79_00052g087820 [Physcia stellaris]|nr:hypothetical protein G7Y79_00052g087820 [Physcia stellaris]
MEKVHPEKAADDFLDRLARDLPPSSSSAPTVAKPPATTPGLPSPLENPLPASRPPPSPLGNPLPASRPPPSTLGTERGSRRQDVANQAVRTKSNSPSHAHEKEHYPPSVSGHKRRRDDDEDVDTYAAERRENSKRRMERATDGWTTWLNAQDAVPFGAGIVIMCTALVRRNAPNVTMIRVDTSSKPLPSLSDRRKLQSTTMEEEGEAGLPHRPVQDSAGAATTVLRCQIPLVYACRSRVDTQKQPALTTRRACTKGGFHGTGSNDMTRELQPPELISNALVLLPRPTGYRFQPLHTPSDNLMIFQSDTLPPTALQSFLGLLNTGFFPTALINFPHQFHHEQPTLPITSLNGKCPPLSSHAEDSIGLWKLMIGWKEVKGVV